MNDFVSTGDGMRLWWDSRAIQGSIEFKVDEQPFINLTLPGGQRVSGWVDNRVQIQSWAARP